MFMSPEKDDGGKKGGIWLANDKFTVEQMYLWSEGGQMSIRTPPHTHTHEYSEVHRPNTYSDEPVTGPGTQDFSTLYEKGGDG